MLSSIFVYDESPDISQLDELVQLVNSGTLNDSDFINNVLVEIRKCIDKAVSEKKSKKTYTKTNIEEFARGSSSCCFRTLRGEGERYIFKVFSPQFHDGKNKYNINCDSGFNWISDDANFSQKQSWLKRYVRFIKQRGIINKNNSFFGNRAENGQYQQMVLTSYGYAYRINLLYGDTLEDKAIGDDGIDFACKDKNTTIKQVLDCVENVRKAAEYIDKYCHSQGYYHGDIKPENFLVPNNFTTVINIDFDTWIDEGVIKEKLQPLYSATTQLYYDNISACKTIEDWRVYDVRALSKTLMFMLIGKHQNEFNNFCASCINCNKKIDWIKFFFASKSVGYNLFDLMMRLQCNTEKFVNFPMLFVFNKIKDCIIRSCSTDLEFSRRIITISDFIVALKDIENLLCAINSGNAPEKLDESAIRYLGLKRLDAERNKPLQHVEYDKLIDQGLSCDWVQYVIEKNYYEQEKDDCDKIDRRLIPDIKYTMLTSGEKSRLCTKSGEPIKGMMEKEYICSGNDNKSSLEKLYEELSLYIVERHDVGLYRPNLFLTAEGGQGKTTTLRSFWLDFLSGKHNESCLYIDCKMLRGKSKAIENYINIEYNLVFNNLNNVNIVLLLDGANECNEDLRKKGESDVCAFVAECRDLINKKNIRFIISSRSKIITVTEEDKNNHDDYRDHVEFGECTYATVCELNGSQIEYCLEDYAYLKGKPQIVRLLRNNMMLHVFMRLQDYGIGLDQKDIKAGILLDKYFQICFKTRYVRGCIEDLGMQYPTDKALYNKIKEIEKKRKSVKMLGRNDDMISSALKRFEVVLKKLIESSAQIAISVEELNDIDLCTFEKLSILTKNNDGNYAWANEIYQEYFSAIKLKQTLEKMYNNKFKFDDINMLMDLYDDYKYNVLQYAGELLPMQYADFSIIIGNIRNTSISIDNDDIDYCVTGIMVISVLSGNGIPCNVTTIECCAFSDCKILTSIKIPMGITNIGEMAFSDCSNLASIEMPNSITGIESYAFRDCSSLTSIDMPDSVMRVGTGIFDGCSRLTHIRMSSEIIPREKLTFWGCNRLLFQIENGVCYVDKWVVGAIKTISSVKLRSNTVGIWAFAFQCCSKLTTVEIPNGVTIIGDNAFHGCTELTNIEIPDSVTRIGYSAFYNCKNAAKISIGSGIKKIVEIPDYYTIIDEGNEDEDPEILMYDPKWYDEHSEPFDGCFPKTIVMPRRLYADFEKLFGHEDDGGAEIILTND